MTKRSKAGMLELIAPNGKPIGDCTGDEVHQFADFYEWLAKNERHLKDGPQNNRDASEIAMMLFASWRDKDKRAQAVLDHIAANLERALN